MARIRFIFIAALVVLLAVFYLLNRGERPLILMATTTTQDSGLLDILVPELEKDTGLDIEVIAFGTGKVLRSAIDGNADIIMVHDPFSEKIFMDDGYGSERLSIMRNDFIIIGPEDDPAQIATSNSAISAFKLIENSNAPFVSRGDESGTHKAEMRLWQAAALEPGQFDPDRYFLTGAGMGRTLNIAVEKNAYSLTDRATWLTFQNKGNLKSLYSGDGLLENIYSVISINAEKHSHISANMQKLVMNWFKSAHSRNLIGNYTHDETGLYYPLPERQ